jgi:hypothetical protein
MKRMIQTEEVAQLLSELNKLTSIKEESVIFGLRRQQKIDEIRQRLETLST